MNRRDFLKLTGGSAIVVLSAAGPFAASSRADEGVTTEAGPFAQIRVTETPFSKPVPREIVGANHRWPNSGLGMWDAEHDRPDPKIVELSERVNLAVVRYPGGTVANLFDWKKAIGPEDQRGCQVGGGFVGGAQPYDSIYGPDEHMKYVDMIGAEAQIMMPAALESTQDAADWVEYMNAPLGTNPNGGVAWAEVRAANGHPEPYGIKWWEIGNEPYNGGQRYWRSADYDTAMRQYALGGTQRQVGQQVGTECDHRPSASISDGSANQEFQVWYPPAVPDSQTIYVDGSQWQQVSDLSQAGPDDNVYEFDPTTGKITFGDGAHGQIPPKGAKITADYDSGPHPGFVDYYEAMKAVDPSIDIGASWARPEFVELMGTEHPYDFLTPHLYFFPDVSVGYEGIYKQLMTAAQKVLDELVDLDAALDKYAPASPRPYIGVSEYGHISQRNTRPGPRGWGGSLMSSMYFGMVVAGMVEHGVAFAESSNLNGPRPTAGELFGGAPNFYYTARAHVHELFSYLAGSQPVVSEVTSNPEATGDADYDTLQVISTRASDGAVRLIVFNRDREKDVTARIHVDMAAGLATVRASIVNAAEYSDYNTANDPDNVTTQVSEHTVAAPDFAHNFPAHSVTLLEVTQET